MNVPARKPALGLTKAPAREHPVAPVEALIAETSPAPVPVTEPPAAEAPKSRGMGTMTFRVDLDLRHEVKRYAFEHDVTVQTVVADALREYLKKHRK